MYGSVCQLFRMRTWYDFVLGGRSLGPWVTAISERASGESSWFLLGLPGAAYGAGFTEFWSVVGIASGIFVSWVFISMPLRRQSEALGALTLPDYLELRFKDHTHALRWVSLLVCLFFYTVYVGAQFVGAGKILNATFGMNPLHGIILGALVVAFYTFMGGFLAVAWTDLIQGLLMVAVAVVLPIAGLIKLGGTGPLWAALAEKGPGFMQMTGGKVGMAFFFGVMVANLAWGFGYLGQPHLLTRYMAIRKTRELRQGGLIAMVWVLLAYWGVCFIGIEGVALQKIGVLGVVQDPEQIMPLVAKALMPGWLAGLMIAGAVAAMMSTADSQLLVATSSLVEDIYARLINPKASARKLVWLSRAATLAITFVGLSLALFGHYSKTGGHLIYDVVSYAWTGLGASFGPALILGLWWKRCTRTGALAGMVTGLGATIFWKHIPYLQNLLDLKAAAPLLAFGVVVSVSLLFSEET